MHEALWLTVDNYQLVLYVEMQPDDENVANGVYECTDPVRYEIALCGMTFMRNVRSNGDH